ncbi:MAG: glycosyltransferase family 4 protein [Nevskiaceae bacterium]
MRIAYLCKRRYMSKDVILDRYARLYEIPFQLARLGHPVRAWCLLYQASGAGRWTHDAGAASIDWISRGLVPGLAAYPYRVLREVEAFAPDLLIGASDIPHVVLTAWLARRLARPWVADLYDNFEGFGQARIPGFVPALRRAVRGADVVLTTSEPLRERVLEEYGARGQVMAMPSSVDKAVFRPRDRATARRALGLPADGLLVGTAGGLTREKGIADLYAAWSVLRDTEPSAHLVLAGPHESGFPPPPGPRVHVLGALAHERVAELFSALDVGAICVRDTPFGRYCFPQKVYEMLACGLPVVAADIGATGRFLSGTPGALYRSGDGADLAAKLRAQLEARSRPDVRIDSWQDLIGAIEPKLRGLVRT